MIWLDFQGREVRRCARRGCRDETSGATVWRPCRVGRSQYSVLGTQSLLSCSDGLASGLRSQALVVESPRCSTTRNQPPPTRLRSSFLVRRCFSSEGRPTCFRMPLSSSPPRGRALLSRSCDAQRRLVPDFSATSYSPSLTRTFYPRIIPTPALEQLQSVPRRSSGVVQSSHGRPAISHLKSLGGFVLSVTRNDGSSRRSHGLHAPTEASQDGRASRLAERARVPPEPVRAGERRAPRARAHAVAPVPARPSRPAV